MARFGWLAVAAIVSCNQIIDWDRFEPAATGGAGGPACDADTESDPENCGECGNVCPSVDGFAATCEQSECSLDCDEGLSACSDGCFDLESDGTRCGGCDIQCAGAECISGRCQPAVLGTAQNLQNVAVKDGYVYWLKANLCQVARCPTTGCDQQPEILYDEMGGPCGGKGLAVDDEFVFWSEGNDAATTQMRRCPNDGCVDIPDQLATGVGVMGRPSLDPTRVLWRNPSTGDIRYVDKGGGGSVTAILNQGTEGGVASDGTTLYFATGTGMQVKICAIDDCMGTATPIATETVATGPIAIDGDNVYYATTDRVLSVPLSGGGTPEPLVTGVNSPRDIALSATHVFWVGNPPSQVLKRGGQVVAYGTFAWELPVAIAYDIDDPGFFYVADRGAEVIVRIQEE